jgi:hypothetical protein
MGSRRAKKRVFVFLIMMMIADALSKRSGVVITGTTVKTEIMRLSGKGKVEKHN